MNIYTYIYNYCFNLEKIKSKHIKIALNDFYNTLQLKLQNKLLEIIKKIASNINDTKDIINNYCIEYDIFYNNTLLLDKLLKYAKSQANYINVELHFDFLEYNKLLWKINILTPLINNISIDYINIFNNIDSNLKLTYVPNDYNSNDDDTKIDTSTQIDTSNYDTLDVISETSSISSISSYNNDNYELFILLNFINKMHLLYQYNLSNYEDKINLIINKLINNIASKLESKLHIIKNIDNTSDNNIDNTSDNNISHDYLILYISRLYNHYKNLFKKVAIYSYIKDLFDEIFIKIIINNNIDKLLYNYNKLLKNYNKVLNYTDNINLSRYIELITLESNNIHIIVLNTRKILISELELLKIENNYCNFEKLLIFREKLYKYYNVVNNLNNNLNNNLCNYDYNNLIIVINNIIHQYITHIKNIDFKLLNNFIHTYITTHLYKNTGLHIDTFKTYFIELINILEDESVKEHFMINYKTNLIKRLLSHDLNNNKLEKEYIIINYFNTYVDNCCISKINKMLNDVDSSFKLQYEFNSIYNSKKYNLLCLTNGIWPLNDIEYTAISSEYNIFKTQFNNFYKCKYENRNLNFCENLSSCILVYNIKNTNYEINCSIKQCDMLLGFNNNDKLLKSNNYDSKVIDSLIKYKLILEDDSHYLINNKFKCKKMKFNINVKLAKTNNKKISKKIDNTLVFDENDYCRTFIVSKMKKEKTLSKIDLIESIKNKYKYDDKTINTNIKYCLDNDYINQEHDNLIYII
jgi:hypothetical protein